MNLRPHRAGCLGTLAILAAITFALGLIFLLFIRPWYTRWGATAAERTRTLPGDGLVPAPERQSTKAITIQAPIELVWPWLAQLGAGKGGWYSYEKLENLMGCPIKNVDRIVMEWQHLEPGDLVYLCPPGKPGPPPYVVAEIKTGDALVLGQPGLESGTWASTWQFILEDVDGQSTRLITRDRTQSAGVWDLLEPAIFIMQRAMLLGIKSRAEALYAGNFP